MPTDDTEVIELLKKYHEFKEIVVCEKCAATAYKGSRNGKEVTVRIIDHGANANEGGEFECEVKQEDGEKAHGDRAATIEKALSSVNWSDLDTNIRTIDLEAWSDFPSAVEEIKQEYGFSGVLNPEIDETIPGAVRFMVFRGHANANWELRTTLERYSKKKEWTIQEYTHKILACAQQFDSIPDNKENAPSWESMGTDLKLNDGNRNLCLPRYPNWVYLRHYNFPSPLLDWTDCPFIAAHFAFSEEEKEAKRVAIWVHIDATTGMKTATGGEPTIRLLGPSGSSGERAKLQQSMFTIAYKAIVDCHIFVPHDDVERTDPKQDVLRKITIPVSERITALRSLNEMRITHYSLFRSKDARAKDLAQQLILFHEG